MTINKKVNGDIMTMKIEGRLDTMTAPQLAAEWDNSLVGIKALVLDCSELEYVSSAGLRVILKAQKIMQSKGGMVLRHVNENVMEVFEITGFSSILSIEE